MNRIFFQLRPSMRKVLKKCNLLEEAPIDHSNKTVLWKDLNHYKMVWEEHYKNKTFHFRLKDHSLFRFIFNETRLTFEYLNCPYIFDYILHHGELFEDEDYTEVLPTPIRYDYEPSIFNPISHPIGHIHIGIENEIRIGTDCAFNPMSFILFCLRQMYPDNWNKLLLDDSFSKYQKHIREKNIKIRDSFKAAFAREHYIT